MKGKAVKNPCLSKKLMTVRVEAAQPIEAVSLRVDPGLKENHVMRMMTQPETAMSQASSRMSVSVPRGANVASAKEPMMM